MTIPHKEAALALADTASAAAREIGAANTLSFTSGDDGAARIAAENTDAGGLLASLPSLAARRAGAGARRRRRRPCGDLGPGPARAPRSRSGTGPRRGRGGLRRARRQPRRDPDQARYGLIVNTSAAGLRGEDPFEHLPLARDGFAPEQTVVDMVYGETPEPAARRR